MSTSGSIYVLCTLSVFHCHFHFSDNQSYNRVQRNSITLKKALHVVQFFTQLFMWLSFLAAASIMIISNVSNESLAKVMVKSEPKFENKSHRQTFSFSKKLYFPIFFICILCLSWKMFYSRHGISILFYIYHSHKSYFIRVSVTNYTN